MVVITLEKCPIALRGDLTKWLQEISPGVYVGQVSARVRDNLWERVCAESKSGRATMVFSARNEQHLDFRVHNTLWEPIDFDGIKLMLRPSSSRIRSKADGDAYPAGMRRRNRVGKKKVERGEPGAYVVVDIETTGLDPELDAIIEIGGIKYEEGEEVGSFSVVVKTEVPVPTSVCALTGISQEDVDAGASLEDAITDFVTFVGSCPIVMHNANFDMSFIDEALDSLDMDELGNQCIDTLVMSRKLLPKMTQHRLSDLCSHYGIDAGGAHRALADCRMTHDVFISLLREDGG
jgi:CRISPR-associated protein Cas2